MSDMALTKLFNRLDTSNDGLTSVRELTNFVSTWEPTTSEQRQLKIVGSMFGVVGFLETAYLLGFFFVHRKQLPLEEFDDPRYKVPNRNPRGDLFRPWQYWHDYGAIRISREQA